jgi:hypothetical protein
VFARIKEYALDKYSHFLDETHVVAAFRQYLVDRLAYQVLFSAQDSDDTFNLVMDYYPSDDSLDLKSLALLDFSILDFSSKNCLFMKESNCDVCVPGYGFFRGRCHEIQA